MKTLKRTFQFHVVFALSLLVYSVSAATGMNQEGTVINFKVEEGEILSWTEPFPSDTTQVFKRGKGTLELNVDNNAYKGPVDIVEGVVKIFHRNALGKSTDNSILTDGAISVSNGAQLVTLCDAAVSQLDKVLNKRIVLAGSGPNGDGVLRMGSNSQGKNQDSYLAYVVLADDAVIVNTDANRYGICKIDLQGYELTTTGENTSGSYMLNSTSFITDGTIRHKKLQTVWQNKITFPGGEEGRIILDEGASLRLYSGFNETICPWTLELAGQNTVSLSVNGSWLKTFTGPVIINATVNVTGGEIAFLGKVSGSGTLRAYGKLLDMKSELVRTSGVLSIGYFEKSSATPALLKVSEGSIVTNKLDIGNEAGRIGGMIQTGGIVYNSASTDKLRYLGFGNNAYGYYGMTDGYMRFDSNWRIGGSAGAVGMIEVAGGVMNIISSPLRMGYNGWGEIYMTGGNIRFGGPIIGSDASISSGTVTLTLAGEGVPVFELHYGDLAKLTPAVDNSVVSLNLNAGTFIANSIVKNKKESTQSGAKAYLNFNGGTWETKYNSTSIFGTGETALDRVTVFERGARLNMNGFSGTQEYDTPILRPSGRGIKSISLPEGMNCAGYAGPPEVVITGGGGNGATAHAIFDAATRMVTGVEVTCSGWDYESEPEVKIYSANRTLTYECVAVLTDDDRMDGGLIVDGTHYLTLKAVNTYRGDTVIKGTATIDIKTLGALPAESTVVFAGGELKNNSGVQHKKYAIDCSSAMQASGYKFYNAVDFSNGATLDIRNADEFPREASKTVLMTFVGKVTGVPKFTGVNNFQRVTLVDGKLAIENIKGTVMVIR